MWVPAEGTDAMVAVAATMKGVVAGAIAIAGLTLAASAASAAPNVWVRDGNGGGSVFNGGPGYVTMHMRVVRPNNTVWTPGVNVGAFALQYSTTSNGGPWTSFLTYCLEPDETLSINSNGTAYGGTLANTLSSTAEYSAAAPQLRALYNNYFADSLTSATKSAAFQVAVWEIAYETSSSYNAADLLGNSAGTFRLINPNATTNAVVNQALSYLSIFNGAWAPGAEVGTILRIGNQDLLVQVPVPVPEPATLGLLGAGLIGLGLAARRRRRAA